MIESPLLIRTVDLLILDHPMRHAFVALGFLQAYVVPQLLKGPAWRPPTSVAAAAVLWFLLSIVDLALGLKAPAEKRDLTTLGGPPAVPGRHALFDDSGRWLLRRGPSPSRSPGKSGSGAGRRTYAPAPHVALGSWAPARTGPFEGPAPENAPGSAGGSLLVVLFIAAMLVGSWASVALVLYLRRFAVAARRGSRSPLRRPDQ